MLRVTLHADLNKPAQFELEKQHLYKQGYKITDVQGYKVIFEKNG